MTNIKSLLNKKLEDRLQTPSDDVSLSTESSPYVPPGEDTYTKDNNENILDPLSGQGNDVSSESYHPISIDSSNSSESYHPDPSPYKPSSPNSLPSQPKDNVYPTNDDIEDGEIQGGGSNRYNLGERVCMRNCNDNYPTRPWKVTHVGPKFLTIHALDKVGLSDSDAVNVVLPFDIYPESDAHIYAPKIPQSVMQPQVQSENNPNVVPNQPTVVIAPKFFNGNGSDNSTNEGAIPQADAMPIDNFLNSTQSPNIVVKENANSKPVNEMKTENIDFNNLVIKKV